MATAPVTPAVLPSKAWRPPQWNKPAKVMVTVPPGYSGSNPAGAVDPNTNNYTIAASTTRASTSYVFDAVLSLEHSQQLTKTRHPVQTGSAITSHAYLEPADLVLYVLMSDVAAQFVPSNQTIAPYIAQFTGNPSKSVSAYQQMLTLQNSRIPLTVVTRLRTYYNMLIDSISPHEDNKTNTGVRFRIQFGQILMATTQVQPSISTRPNDTNASGLGTVNPQPVPAAVTSQFGVHSFGPGVSPPPPLPPDLNNGSIPVVDNGVPGYLGPGYDPAITTTKVLLFTPQYPNNVPPVDVPGAGDLSSVNVNSLPQSTGK